MTVENTKNHREDYLKAFKRGEGKGFTFFFQEHYISLCLFADRLLKNRLVAEDIVGESFIKLWNRHSSFCNPRHIRSFLYTIVRNGCIDFLRQEKRKAVSEKEIAYLLDQESEKYILQEMIRAEAMSQIYKAFKNLPTACQKVFRMIYFEDKNVKQIAQELNLSISTVKSHKARGLTLLKKRLPNYWLFTIFACSRYVNG